MRRRAVITGAVAAAVAPASAQTGRPLVGYIGAATREESFERALLEGLREADATLAQATQIEFHYANGVLDNVRTLAQALLGRRARVIVTAGGVAARIVGGLTSTVPIVFATDPDPLSGELVASLARPGGNVTGFSMQSIDLDGKRMEMLRAIAPRARQIGLLLNPATRTAEAQREQLARAAQLLGFALFDMSVRTPQEIDTTFAAASRAGVGGVLLVRDFFIETERERIVRLAAQHRLPAVYEIRRFAELGGLLSYSADVVDLHRRAGRYVARILRGARPADLPVEQASVFRLVVNLRTAQALGLDLPATILARADEVIE